MWGIGNGSRKAFGLRRLAGAFVVWKGGQSGREIFLEETPLHTKKREQAPALHALRDECEPVVAPSVAWN